MDLELLPEQRAWLLSDIRPPEHPQTLHVTELISPTWQTALERKHPEVVRASIESNPSRMGAMMIGTAVHESMARFLRANGHPEGLVEYKMTHKITLDGQDWTITGTPDYWYPEAVDNGSGGISGHLRDWKTCKNYKLIQGDFSEWERQLNIYSWMLRQLTDRVTLTATIGATLTDFSAIRAAYKPKEPQQQMGGVPIKLHPPEMSEVFCKEQIRGYAVDREKAASGKAGACSPEDRWRDMRCKHYCFVREMCPHYQQNINNKKG